jgi:hypothetical protein
MLTHKLAKLAKLLWTPYMLLQDNRSAAHAHGFLLTPCYLTEKSTYFVMTVNIEGHVMKCLMRKYFKLCLHTLYYNIHLSK